MSICTCIHAPYFKMSKVKWHPPNINVTEKQKQKEGRGGGGGFRGKLQPDRPELYGWFHNILTIKFKEVVLYGCGISYQQMAVEAAKMAIS